MMQSLSCSSSPLFFFSFVICKTVLKDVTGAASVVRGEC